ncbi:MAG: RNA-guided endonuclease InsQ/TnpB family protein, partial [Acidimicrobiales bacterium]
HTAAASNGSFYDAPDLQAIERRRRYHQKRMAKSRVVAKSEGRNFSESKRYQVHKKEAARLAGREARIREDFAHQLSTSMVREFDFVGIEDLALSRMTRKAHGKGAAAKRGLNRALQNAALAQLATLLEYKCKIADVPFVKVNPAYTSQRCHQCGHTCKESRESQAVFLCRRCAWTGNADYNAAVNILKTALEQWARTCGPAGSKGETEARKDPARLAGGACDEPRTARAVA